MTETLRERVRERLAEIIDPDRFREYEITLENIHRTIKPEFVQQTIKRRGVDQILEPAYEKADAILREFRLQPVAVGRVAGDDSEVTPL